MGGDKLQPVTKDNLVLYDIILQEVLTVLDIDPFYPLDIPRSFHNEMHEDIMKIFNEIMEDEHITTQESTKEAQSQHFSHQRLHI